MIRSFLIATAVGVMTFGSLEAQIAMPQPSPAASVMQKIGLTDFTVTYSRPSMKGREIFGKLVPYGKLWRTGANSATVIEFNSEAMFGGKKVAAGKYALATIPGEKEWTVILNKNVQMWGVGGYKEADDVARFTVPSEPFPFSMETFMISFMNVTDNSSDLAVVWDKTRIRIPIKVEFDSQVMKSIDEKMANIANEKNAAGIYYQSARYYFDNNKDIKKALDWITKSVEMDTQKKYWVLHLKAKIEQKAGDKKAALATANESLELAQKDGNDDYVALNKELISQLK